MKVEYKSILDEVKRLVAKFNGEPTPEPTPEPTKFEQATLEDGTIVEWDGELAEGIELFVVDGETRIPAPIGTHTTTEGVQVIVEEIGKVASVVLPVEQEETTSETQAPADSEFKSQVNAMFSLMEKIAVKLAEMESNHAKDIELVRTEFNEFKSKPSNEVRESSKFNREGSNLTARQQFLLQQRKK